AVSPRASRSEPQLAKPLDPAAERALRARPRERSAICLSVVQRRRIARAKRDGGPRGEAPGSINGAEGQNRTGDTVIFSHVLYQLSYLGTVGRKARGRRKKSYQIARPSGP